MKKTIILIGLIMLILPLISAVELNSSQLFSSGLNLTINITSSIYFDSLTVASNSIYFDNIRTTDSGTEYLDYNITEVNKTYIGSSNLPLITSSSDTTKVITSNLNSLNSTIVMTFTDCRDIATITTSTGQKFIIPTCTGTSVQLDNLLISGNTTLTVNYDRASIKTCQGWFDGAMSYGTFIVILIIVCVAGFIVLMLMGGDGSEIDLTMWAVIITIAGVVMALGMYIISNIGGC